MSRRRRRRGEREGRRREGRRRERKREGNANHRRRTLTEGRKAYDRHTHQIREGLSPNPR